MRKNPYYIVSSIGDEFYLVPFGQAIENHAHTIHISEVAAFIWDELDAYSDVKVLAGKVAEEYEVTPEEVASVGDDVRQLLLDFIREGVVLEEEAGVVHTRQVYSSAKRIMRFINNEDKSVAFQKTGIAAAVAETRNVDTPFHTMRIADITIRFFGSEKYFSDNFATFCADAQSDEGIEERGISVYVMEADPPINRHLPLVLRGMSVELYDGGDFYIMRSIDMPEMREGHFWKDGSKAVLYMDPDAELPDFVKRFRYDQNEDERLKKKWRSPEDVQVDYAGCVFHAIRHAFLLRAQCLDMYVIHSASILYNGQAWLFSALSGTGKSTHTNLWHKLYGTPFLNGDLNLLAFEDGKPVVKGIPWCGTSGIFTTETYPLGGIILLARDKTNHVEELSYQNQVLGIQMRFISPKWNAKQTSESIDFAERIAKSARIARLYCNMEDEAAEVCRAWIDNGKS